MNKYLHKIETRCRTVKQYLFQLKKISKLWESLLEWEQFFFQLIGKRMVFNSKSSKKSHTCLQDEKIYPVKLFVIVILHQSKWSITKPPTTKKSPTTDKRPPTNWQVLHRPTVYRPSEHIKTDPTTTKPQPTDRFSTDPSTTDPMNILEPTQRPQNPNPLTGSPPIHQPPTHWPPTHRPPSK